MIELLHLLAYFNTLFAIFSVLKVCTKNVRLIHIFTRLCLLRWSVFLNEILNLSLYLKALWSFHITVLKTKPIPLQYHTILGIRQNLAINKQYFYLIFYIKVWGGKEIVKTTGIKILSIHHTTKLVSFIMIPAIDHWT